MERFTEYEKDKAKHIPTVVNCRIRLSLHKYADNITHGSTSFFQHYKTMKLENLKIMTCEISTNSKPFQ